MEHPYCCALCIFLYCFAYAWRCVMSCDMTYTASHGQISSPNTYTGAQQCSYTVRLPSGNRIHLEWQKFNFSGSMPGCAEEEFMRISRCTNPVKQLIRYCGQILPNDFYSYDNCIVIDFQSTDGWNQTEDMKFLLQYETLNLSRPLYPVQSSPDCFNIRASNNTISIHTPNWPLSYNKHLLNGDSCKTTIKFHKNWKMNVLFMGLDLYAPYRITSRKGRKRIPCEDARNDVLTITTYGSDASSGHEYHYCAHLQPFTKFFDSWLDRVDITLTTGISSAHNHKGFALGIMAFNRTDHKSKGGWRSPVIIIASLVATVILLCLLGCVLGIMRDFCKYEIRDKSVTRTDDVEAEQDMEEQDMDMAEQDMEEQDMDMAEQDMELTEHQDVESCRILYMSSV